MDPGYFGKVPARGDFLSRRVPPTISAAWEGWLQGLTAAARASGRPGWQDAWLTAPIWHFAFGPGLAGPHGAAGLLIGSADRVGRLFPWTVIAAASPEGIAWDSWSERMEPVALTALDDGLDPAGLDAALAAIGPPAAGAGGDRSEWWTRGSDTVEPRRWSRSGLPTEGEAVAMLFGA